MYGLISSLHLIGTVAMTGVIWFVQLVHYPTFLRIKPEDFSSFERDHQKRAGWIVVPLILLEGGSAVTLFVLRPEGVSHSAVTIGLVLLVLIWFSTAALQLPCHRRLERGFDDSTIRRLIRTNWIRTLSWSLRVPLALLIQNDLTGR